MAKKNKQSDADSKDKPKGIRIQNRRAFRDYAIQEKIECGIELFGTEVKSLRMGAMKIDEAYARLEKGQLFLVGANIAVYPQATEAMNHVPTRKRRLLVHRRQIHQLEAKVHQKGLTLVPLAIYFHRGWAKIEIGLGLGKRQYDKRDVLKQRQQKRDIDRQMRRR